VIAIIADSPGKTAPKKDEYIPGDMWVDGVSEDDGTKEITDPGRMLPLGGMITN
jgi:hypothetical protein